MIVNQKQFEKLRALGLMAPHKGQSDLANPRRISNTTNYPSLSTKVTLLNHPENISSVIETFDIRESDPHARVVLSFDNLDIDLPNDLKQECKLNAKEYENKLFAVLKEVTGSPALEGRGIYHPARQEGRFIYVKGAGNKDALKQNVNGSCRAAFGAGANLFYDQISIDGSAHPRVCGTETVLWGGLEFVTAVAIFGELVKEFNIENLEQARKMGLVIPIGVSKFEKLSKEISKNITQYANSLTEMEVKEKALWYGNFMGIGAVALEVPSNSRMQSNPFKSSTNETKRINLLKRTDSENISTLARTLRTLLKHGYIYSNASSHLQNIYVAPGSKCAQADSSDILHLRSIPKDLLSAMEKQGISSNDLEIELIAQQLSQGFTYADNDIAAKQFSHDDKELLRSSRIKLICELLGKTYDPSKQKKQIEAVADLFDIDSFSVAKAMARSLHQEFNNSQWDQAATRFEKALISAGHVVDLKSQYQQRCKRFCNAAVTRYSRKQDIANIVSKIIQGNFQDPRNNNEIKLLKEYTINKQKQLN